MTKSNDGDAAAPEEAGGGKILFNVAEMLRILAEYLYSRPDVAIRELLANASDGIHRREALGRAAFGGEIRVAYDVNTGQLEVSDNGIGMTADEVRDYLSKVGESNTRLQKQQDPALALKLIGHFGVGVLSSVVLAERVQVRTRHVDAPPEDGVVWECKENSDRYVMRSATIEQPGTTFRLFVRRDRRRTLGGDNLKESVRRYGAFLRFPIVDSLGVRLNETTPPWASGERVSTEELTEWASKFYQIDPPVYTIQLRPVTNEGARDIDIRGVVYVPSELRRVNTTGACDLYVKGMLIGKDLAGVLPGEMLFLSGVCECPQLEPILSREDVRRGVDFQRFAQEVQRQIHRGLAGLATRPTSLRRMNVVHGQALRNYLRTDDFAFSLDGRGTTLFDELIEVLPFLRSDAGTTSLAEYREAMERRKSDAEKDVIYYSASTSDTVTRQIDRVMEKRGIGVIHLSDPPRGKHGSLDLALLEKYRERRGLKLRAAEERDDLFSDKVPDKLKNVSEIFESILYYVALPAAAPRVNFCVVQPFEPGDLPLIMFRPKRDKAQEAIEQALADRPGAKMNDPVMQQIFQLAQKGLTAEKGVTQVYLNSGNELIRKLADYNPESFSARLVAVELFHQGLQNAGYRLTEGGLTLVTNQRMKVLELLLACHTAADDFVAGKEDRFFQYDRERRAQSMLRPEPDDLMH